MVKFIFSFFWLFLCYACQTQTYTKAELAAYDEIAYQYTSKLFEQYNACVDSFDQTKMWQPKGMDTAIELKSVLITCIPCLRIVKPILAHKKWIENNHEFNHELPLTNFALQRILMKVIILKQSVMMDFLFPLWFSIEDIHKWNEKGALGILKKISIHSPEKEKFEADIKLLLHGVSYPDSDTNSNLKIPIPPEFQPYYNTQVIDRKWVLDVFEQSGAYRAWLEKTKPFFDEIANVLPDEKYVQFFYRLYNSPQIDSNFTVYQFYTALHSDTAAD